MYFSLLYFFLFSFLCNQTGNSTFFPACSFCPSVSFKCQIMTHIRKGIRLISRSYVLFRNTVLCILSQQINNKKSNIECEEEFSSLCSITAQFDRKPSIICINPVFCFVFTPLPVYNLFASYYHFGSVRSLVFICNLKNFDGVQAKLFLKP